MIRLSHSLFLIAVAGMVAPAAAQAQTLAARPVLFVDPHPGNDVRQGELILGKTTLAGAQRILAEVLSNESVRVPLGHTANPSTLPANVWWPAGADSVQPRYQLDLGPDRYTLYFDASQRLVVVLTRKLPRRVTRAELLAHYPTMRLLEQGSSGDESTVVDLVAPLGGCVELTVEVLLETEQVDQLGYVYTCPTGSAGHPAGD